jgi:ketosteroid isomerase-like protein
MRNHLTPWVLTSVLFFACAREIVDQPPLPPVNWESLKPHPQQPVAPRSTATDKERAVASAYTKALGSPDFTELGPLLDEEAHFRFSGGKDAYGRDKVIRAHEEILGKLTERRFVPSRVLLTDSTQVLEWELLAVEKASRKPIAVKGVTLLWTKDDGSISDIHFYFDEAVLKAQTGSGPKTLLDLPPAPVPAGARQEVEQQQGSDEGTNVKLVRAQLQALDDYKPGAYLAPVAEDAELWTLESTRPARGKAGAHSYYQTMARGIKNLAISVNNLWGVGQFVVAEYDMIGEQNGRLGWVPAQHSVIKLSVVDVIEIRNGKITRTWRYDNPLQFVSPS